MTEIEVQLLRNDHLRETVADLAAVKVSDVLVPKLQLQHFKLLSSPKLIKLTETDNQLCMSEIDAVQYPDAALEINVLFRKQDLR